MCYIGFGYFHHVYIMEPDHSTTLERRMTFVFFKNINKICKEWLAKRGPHDASVVIRAVDLMKMTSWINHTPTADEGRMVVTFLGALEPIFRTRAPELWTQIDRAAVIYALYIDPTIEGVNPDGTIREYPTEPVDPQEEIETEPPSPAAQAPEAPQAPPPPPYPAQDDNNNDDQDDEVDDYGRALRSPAYAPMLFPPLTYASVRPFPHLVLDLDDDDEEDENIPGNANDAPAASPAAASKDNDAVIETPDSEERDVEYVHTPARKRQRKMTAPPAPRVLRKKVIIWK